MVLWKYVGILLIITIIRITIILILILIIIIVITIIIIIMQLQNNWTCNMKKHNLWMGEILKQHTIIVHKQITDRPLTDICEKVFLSPCYFFYVAFFSLALLLCCTFLCCTVFTLQCNLHSIHMALFPFFILSIMHFFPVALLSWCNFLNLNSSLLH